jgi:hypothetical protein
MITSLPVAAVMGWRAGVAKSQFESKKGTLDTAEGGLARD